MNHRHRQRGYPPRTGLCAYLKTVVLAAGGEAVADHPFNARDPRPLVEGVDEAVKDRIRPLGDDFDSATIWEVPHVSRHTEATSLFDDPRPEANSLHPPVHDGLETTPTLNPIDVHTQG